MRGAARSLVPALPGSVWRVLTADAFSAVGSGLTVPFLVVYLQARGLTLGQAAAAATSLAAAGLVGNPVGGWLADRIGQVRAVVVGLLTAATGALLLAVAAQPWPACSAAAVAGAGAAIAWPAQDALLARLAGPTHRSSAFALRHLTMNVGLGGGSVVAAFLADTADADSFTLLYVLDSASFVFAVPVLLTVAREVRPTGACRRERGGYRHVWRDGTFVRTWVQAALMITVGYGAFQVVFPAAVIGSGGVTPWLGLAFTANTIAVVITQLGVLRMLGGRRRTRAARWAAATWAGTWALVLMGGWIGDVTAVAWFVAAAVVFAVGETLLPPTLPAIVNDIAPEALRGRYNGGLTLAYTTGFMAGPLLCGFVLERGPGLLPLCLGLIIGCLLCAAMATRLERRIPADANVVPAADYRAVAQPTPAGAIP